MSPDVLRTYLVTDPALCDGPRLLSLLPSLVEAGVSCVQVRDKRCSTRELLELCRALVERARPLGVPVVVNDRADVAFAADAAGVHLGRADLPVELARHLLGPKAIIGASLESVEPAAIDAARGADYLAVSPVFATRTKLDTAPALGLEGIRRLADRAQLPIVGIGGIGVKEAFSVVSAGAAGVAVVSAILGAPDPVEATRAIRREVDAALRERTTA